MEVQLKYGKASLALHIPKSAADVLLLETGRTPASVDQRDLVRSALAAPIDSPRLSDIVSAGKRVAVITSDITRPCPSARLLPFLLDELGKGGVRDQDITVVFGMGSHRPHTEEERSRLAGQEVYRRVRCIDSDPTQVEVIGHTRRGTPVAVYRPVLDTDVRVCLGGIDYHYFMGYGGGYKAVVPGVCGVDTIQHNHRMMTAPGAVAGNLDGNPARADIDEAGEMVGADFILNVILDPSERIVAAVAGHPLAAHRAGCARLDAFGQVTVERPVDVVVASAGGYPKDINLYQAQKAMDNARQIVRPGGIIVLVAECAEGSGNDTFEEWMLDGGGPDAIIARIRQRFVLGGHKAAAVAMAMRQAEILLVSALPAHFVRAIGLYPFDRLEDALQSALTHTGTFPSVAVLPEGGSVLPVVAGTVPVTE